MKTITVNLTDHAYKKLRRYVTTKLLIEAGGGLSPDLLVAKKIVEAMGDGDDEVSIRTKEDVR